MTRSNRFPEADTAPYRYSAELAREIESKWQKLWADAGSYQVANPVGDLSEGFVTGRRRYFTMDMFPYPSGAGLHVGHPLGFIGSDVFARFKRMQGYEVLHPFGFDAFGLPAEQYAIETGQHPAVTTAQNIDNMRRQLRRLGLAHDTRREVSTADPAFYRWTQWIFLQIFNAWCDPESGQARPIAELIDDFEHGRREPDSAANPQTKPWGELDEVTRRRVVDSYRLAYLDEAPVNWCPGLGTVLANEEVTAEGRSEIGNYPVYRRTMRQWMMRITAFADRLLADLDPLDWSESLKTMQRNWIGRSEGADLTFAVTASGGGRRAVEVYTTRPDTLFGVTFVVLAPEHPLVDELVTDAWPAGTPDRWRGDGTGQDVATPRMAVDRYRDVMASLSDRQRQARTSKSAVFTGSFAENPATGDRIPVFIADYVLGGYGTGAVMGVPAHDQRDYELAQALELPIRAVVEPPGEWLTAHAATTADEPATWDEAFESDGIATHSSSPELTIDGLATSAAKEAVKDWLEESGHGRRRTSYRLRDWLFSRQRYWGEPFPIVYDETGLPIALPESQLPVTLPPMIDFRPRAVEDDEPRPPLSRVTEFEYVELDLGNGVRRYRREPNTMPQWAGSCWYYLRYLDPTNDEQFVAPEVERYWMANQPGDGHIGGVDLYIGGVEHAVLHLLYARFWHKILFDLGYVSTSEPFQRLYNQGYILADAFTDSIGRYVPAAEVEETAAGPTYRGEPVRRHSGKMGKSLKNAVPPDDIYDAYGADTLRLYEMAMGPLDTDRPWQPDDIVGVYRFLQRLWRNVIDEERGLPRESTTLARNDDLYVLLHRTIDTVGSLYAELRNNVALARLTAFNNALTRYVVEHGSCPRDAAEALTLMVSPLAPHVAAELWSRLGNGDAVDREAFPAADQDALDASQVVLAVTVNGKPRGELTISAEAGEPEVTQAALRLESITKLVVPADVARVVFVPGRLVNLVTRKS